MSTRLHCLALAAALGIGGAAFSAHMSPGLAQGLEETPKDIIAAHIRTQGYVCQKPLSAERDRASSRPDEPVWLLKCEGSSYRVRLIPDMAAEVRRVD
jgi:hypothetical protein